VTAAVVLFNKLMSFEEIRNKVFGAQLPFPFSPTWLIELVNVSQGTMNSALQIARLHNNFAFRIEKANKMFAKIRTAKFSSGVAVDFV